MAIDTRLNDRIEAVLHAMGVPNSGEVAQAVAAEYAECQIDARAELTIADAAMYSNATTHREMAHKRVQHALDALGGPLTNEDKPEGDKLYTGPVRKP